MKQKVFFSLLLLTIVVFGLLISSNVSAQTDTLVQTPYGLVPKSHVFAIDNKTTIRMIAGHLKTVDMATGKIKGDLGVPSKADEGLLAASRSPYAYAKALAAKASPNAVVEDVTGKIIQKQTASSNTATESYAARFGPGPAGTNSTPYTVYAPLSGIRSFSSTWVVPEKPIDTVNIVTTFLWNGLDGPQVIQPVLQWDQGQGPNYTIANWAIDTSGNFVHGTFLPVNPGDTLTGKVEYVSNTDTSWTYKCSFVGYPDADITITRATEATNPIIEWESYSKLMTAWPDQAYEAFKNNVAILRGSGDTAALAWQGWPGSSQEEEAVTTPSGKNMVIVNNGTPGGEIDAYFGDGTGITPDSVFQVVSAVNGYDLTAAASGSPVSETALNGQPAVNQQWQISDAATAGYYKLTSVSYTTDLLNVSSAANGAQVNIGLKGSSEGQQWKITPLASGYSTISPIGDTTLALNYNTSDGSLTLVPLDTTAASQLFNFIYTPQTQPLQIHSIYFVDSASVSGADDGSSWANAFTSLNSALNTANDGDTIWVAKGTYQTESGSPFSLTKHISIYGGFAGTETSLGQRNYAGHPTILQGNNSSVLSAWGPDNNDCLDGFIITGGTGQNGYENGYGGGIIIINSAPAIRNCAFVDNSASGGYGGAIFAFGNAGGQVLVENCVFTGNNTSYGSVIFTYGSGGSNITASLVNCTAIGNPEAAVFTYSGAPVTVSNSIFYNNGYDFYGYGAAITYDHCYVGTIAGTLTDGGGNVTNSADPFVNSSNPAGADGILGTADDGLYPASTAAINSGDNTELDSIVTLDFGGRPRIVGGTIDMGAYESQNAQALPLTLTSLNGSLQTGMATLSWKSGVESNFKQYEVETSTDGKTFTDAGIVAAKGNNSSYIFNTAQTAPIAYYRLKLTDDNGTSEYSNIIGLSQTGGSNISVYPVPATGYINIKTPGAAVLNIYNSMGQTVKTQQLQAGVNTVYIGNLNTGVYYASVNGQKIKFIKE